MKVLDQEYVREFRSMGDADPNRPVDLMPLKSRLIGNSRSIFLMLSAAVALVLLIACANAAGLLLTRALKRRREVAIRIAMGAARAQLVMQFLTESVILALLGGIAGVGLSIALTRFVIVTVGQSLPRLTEAPISMNLTVLTFMFGLSVVTGSCSG